MSDVRRPTEHPARPSAPPPEDLPARHVISIEDRAESRTPVRFREGAPDRGGTFDVSDRSLVSRR